VVVAEGGAAVALSAMVGKDVQEFNQDEDHVYPIDVSCTFSVRYKLSGAADYTTHGSITLTTSISDPAPSITYLLDISPDTYDIRLVTTAYTETTRGSFYAATVASEADADPAATWDSYTVYGNESDTNTSGTLNWMAYGL
jgi:hypothetical protein